MPKKKNEPKEKRPIDMTSDELARHLFGSEAADELKRIAAGGEQSKNGDNSAQPNDSESV
jgi:hypothetical protein